MWKGFDPSGVDPVRSGEGHFLGPDPSGVGPSCAVLCADSIRTRGVIAVVLPLPGADPVCARWTGIPDPRLGSGPVGAGEGLPPLSGAISAGVLRISGLLDSA